MMLDGKVALVTGASRGLGKRIAIELARCGANVAVNCARSVEQARRVIGEIKKLNRKAILVQTNIVFVSEIEKMVSTVYSEFGRIDILVNNAAIAIRKPIFKITQEFWDETLHVNLRGTFFCSQKVALKMKNSGGGRIINIGSVGGHAGQKYLSAYNASKGGLNLLTKEMAYELAPYNITVNSVAPGGIMGEKNEHLFSNKKYFQEWCKSVPLGRPATEEEVARVVIFFASEDAKYITGQVLYVDGGKTSYIPSSPLPTNEL